MRQGDYGNSIARPAGMNGKCRMDKAVVVARWSVPSVGRRRQAVVAKRIVGPILLGRSGNGEE